MGSYSHGVQVKKSPCGRIVLSMSEEQAVLLRKLLGNIGLDHEKNQWRMDPWGTADQHKKARGLCSDVFYATQYLDPDD